jgi:hypothetical protein
MYAVVSTVCISNTAFATETCVADANLKQLPLKAIAAYIRECENSVPKKCLASENVKEPLPSCIKRNVGDKAASKPYFASTCYSELKARNIPSESVAAFLARCESQAKDACGRVAADLGLSQVDAARFSGSCSRAAVGWP